MEKSIILTCENDELNFTRVSINSDKELYTNAFARKNNKTLFETLSGKKYSELGKPVGKYYLKYVNWPLGKFLLDRKNNYDIFYKEFLNPYGDLEYCRFYITDKETLQKKGLYLFRIKEDVKYIGLTLDSYKKRINDGYGKIHPKNCYKDGQRVNCKINNLASGQVEELEIYLCPLNDDNEIIRIEKRLITKYKPPWNSLFKNGAP